MIFRKHYLELPLCESRITFLWKIILFKARKFGTSVIFSISFPQIPEIKMLLAMHNKCFTIHSLWDHLHRLSSHDTVFSTCAQLTSSTSISSLLLTLPKECKQRIVQASNKSAFTPFSSTPYELHISFRSSKRKNLSS